jgi:redox-sensitive bicupin YhaK (pirin superfamily)
METIYKSVRRVLQPPPHHMVGDGFRVHNFFPSIAEIGMTGMSPFFLMDYGSKWNIPPGGKPRGVGVHPHRGFETVTIAYHGRVAHHDSAGNSGVIREGDVQWMTAGSGVLHKEYHEKGFSQDGGIFQVVQLWVNLPAEFKMTPARYQTIENKNMTKIKLDDGKSLVELIAGEYNGSKGPAVTFSPVDLFNARLSVGATTEFNFDKNFNTCMLLIDGEIKINRAEKAVEDQLVIFNHDGNKIIIEALEDSTVLILSGKPIDEPIASNGPFVMNYESEIKQAYQDYYNGKFGYLED